MSETAGYDSIEAGILIRGGEFPLDQQRTSTASALRRRRNRFGGLLLLPVMR